MLSLSKGPLSLRALEWDALHGSFVSIPCHGWADRSLDVIESSHQLLPHLLLDGFLGDHGESAEQKPLQTGRVLGDEEKFLFLSQLPLSSISSCG